MTKDWHRLEPRVPAPAFSLPTLSGGEPIGLSDLHGQVVLIDFWATWCPPCRQSLPSLESISRAYRSQGVTVLLIDVGETAEQVRAWAGNRFTAPILLDAQHQIEQAYHIDGIPRLFIVDQAGQIAFQHAGYGGGLEHNLKLILQQLLGQHSVRADWDLTQRLWRVAS